MDCAGDGARADFLGATEQYDAVVLDLGLPTIDGLTLLRRWREAGVAVPVLVLTARGSWHEKVAGHRRRRRRLHGQAVPDGRGAGAAARADPARQRPGGAGAPVRGDRARSARGARHRERRAREADQPRVPRALVPDAPPRPRRLAGRADRAHLRARRRPRLEHGRGVHRAAAPEAGRSGDRDRARPRATAWRSA